MATSDDISSLEPHLRPLAATIHAAAEASGQPWLAAVLDARYSDRDRSFIDKVRVERSDGTCDSISLPMEGTLKLIALGEARRNGSDRWYGLLLRIAVDGSCKMDLNYNQMCADDETFFES